MSFAHQISYGLKKGFDDEDLFLQAKEVILNNLLFDILLFWVWNHLWYFSRNYYCSSIFLSCPRVCSTDYVNDKLYVSIALFPQLVQEDIVLMEKVYFFVHFHGAFNVKRKQIVNNFGVLYYESISSPFLLYKTYLEILCMIVYNFVEKKILPLFINNGFSACSGRTACDRRLCQGSCKNKNKFIIYC